MSPLQAAQLQQVLTAVYGLVLSPQRAPLLGTWLERAAQTLGWTPEQLVSRALQGDPEALGELVEELVVAESYFCRHPEQLRAAARWIAAQRPEGAVRAWSAGCSTGEEPLSLAIALVEAGVSLERVTVLGTDISLRSLKRAQQAEYRPWSFRATSNEVRERWFDGPRPVPGLRARVSYGHHNLSAGVPGEGWDLVSCRNVLVYFAPDRAREVARRLLESLAPDGVLLLGSSEMPLANALDAEQVQVPGALLIRKAPPAKAHRPAAPRRTAAPRPEPAPAPPVPRPGPELAERPAHVLLRELVEAGKLEDALAVVDFVEDEQQAVAWSLIAWGAQQQDDLQLSRDAVRRALYLRPDLPLAQAVQASVLGRLGEEEDAARARRNLARMLEGRHDEERLAEWEHLTVGSLRRALAATEQPLGEQP